ncbi:DNA polymerase/3'-5' exonuclease PolX [Streptacidiphilus jiangxiensis]|uniref:DNA polymerase beta n=1 Tax=Streptacidiphilus jiangxiensis TaxID=235985 RepID=A0A1H7WNY1_STRJI|nr:DNA polymerase/3'-5' exonuclease PolX [Streptacidiphilus jiangxiensis]SEM23151.1 DNA polymerase (family 10) [Streptacidiphilus jiangxiensis]
MARLNDQVQALLEEYADLLTITGGDAFRARSYEKSARAIGGWPTDLADMDPKAILEIPGVGKSTVGKIDEVRRTGTIDAVEKLRAKIPPGVRAMMKVPGLGPKRALALHQDLGVSTIDDLRAAAQAGRLHDLPGFGGRTEENILHGLEVLHQAAGRADLGTATALAEEVTAALSAVPGCLRCTWAGSLRRMRETVGDLDVLAAAHDSAPLMEAFVALPSVAEVIVSGPTKTSVRTGAGLQIDLRVVSPEAFGAALVYFTGSKAHNIKLRTLAVRAGLKLSEYGLFDAGTGENLASATEEEVYAALGLAWIPPTLREDRGEVEAAASGELPVLVTERDLRGDLHTHTDLTDGVASLEDMLATAKARGYAYYAVTDHAPDLVMQRMTDEKMLAQRARLQELAGHYGRMRLLHGTELNIGPDGSVDWDAEFLSGFDVCVASVHSHFGADRATQTRRLIRACENPHVHVIGHPSARRVGRRAPIDVDWPAVFAAAARTGTALEINAAPGRMDLNDDHVRAARTAGVRFSIDSDAHSTVQLANPRFGVGTAQRAWLGPDDVINAWPWQKLKRFLTKPDL